MREIIFDTETTGFDPHGGDRMVEIGCVEMVNRVLTGESYHCYYNPQRSMPASAQAVHGLGDAFLADKPLFGGKADELLAFVGDSPLVAHNAKFDFGFLNHELMLCGRVEISLDRMIDTLAMARVIHPGAKHTLDALCTRYGIDRSHRVKQGALLDAELLAQVYIELTGGRQIGLGLDAVGGEAPDPVVEARPSGRGPRPPRPPRSFSATPEELERHRAFVEKLSNPIWDNVSSGTS